MEDPTVRGRDELNLASRKAEEAAWRRFQATEWLNSLVGPLVISARPTEREFISCMRNGLVLCNAINKIQPGSVPKLMHANLLVLRSLVHTSSQSQLWDCQPLPAYQYFENVRNFLVAVEELKLPAFEASDLERDNLEAGSPAKVVDCILALKAYHEWKQMSAGSGIFKPPRSPVAMHSASRTHSRILGTIFPEPRRQLDMSVACSNQSINESENQKLEDLIAKTIAQCMVDKKENIDGNVLTAFHNGNLSLLEKGSCKHRHLFQMQEKELSDLKQLLSTTKKDFEDLQSQLQSYLNQIGNQVQELSIAALGYHKVVKENRKLYNMVQDLKGNIRVYCRIRPVLCDEAKSVIDYIGEDGSLVVMDPLKPQRDGRKVFQFNHVFGPTATQDDVFKETQPLIRSVMDGYNVCIFAYGQTGSGKTYTMCGPSGGSTRDLGINYLALNDLFHLSNKRKDIVKYDIQVQMVEIYKEQVRDLLAEDSSSTKYPFLSRIENGLNLPDATIHSVKSTADVLDLMKQGEVNRAISSTAINNRSSRSHSILTVHVHGKDVSGSVLHSCLHLVDLAGSERVDKSEVTGDGLKEAQYINKSLSCLGDVITALAQKNSYIPYRNSKLTLLLQHSLGGNAKTLMFAHVSPEADSFGETISTLKFAQRASRVELGAASMNKASIEIMELKEQIESLKQELARKEARTVQLPTQKEPRSPLGKPHAMTTPPRPRRLCIESGNAVKMDKALNSVDKRTPKTPQQPRSRRLSLEGPRLAQKGPVLIKTIPSEAESATKYGLSQDAEAATKPHGHRALSPTSYKSQVVIPKHPKTPEPPTLATVQGKSSFAVMEPKTPGLNGSTNGKGSQIRKSLRTIGKLINGSEKEEPAKISRSDTNQGCKQHF
ncbi:Minus-end-directed kinesin ATPase [Bertholletia excelsa]